MLTFEYESLEGNFGGNQIWTIVGRLLGDADTHFQFTLCTVDESLEGIAYKVVVAAAIVLIVLLLWLCH